jgi:hypothetical protein
MSAGTIAAIASLVSMLLQATGASAQTVAWGNAIVSALPGLVAAGISVERFLSQSLGALRSMIAERRDPRPEEWALLNAHIQDVVSRLRAQVEADAAADPA